MSRMLDIKERARWRQLLYSKPTIIALVFLAGLIAHGSWGVYQKSREAELKHAKAEEELAALLEREHELKAEIERLSSPEGLEEEIRERFMVAKEGEKVMIITDPKTREAHTVTITENPEPTLVESVMGAVGLGMEE